MDTSAPLELDTWLAEGGLVVAASDRAARAVKAEFHRRRRKEGLRAWKAPAIADWNTFVREAWEERDDDGLLILSTTQERMLWAEIAQEERHLATMLPGPLYRLAGAAVDAHRLLADYAPRLLNFTARSGWDQDAAAFSRWLGTMEELTRREHLLCSANIQQKLAKALRIDDAVRPPLLLIGFDRILPAQRALLDAWGSWQNAIQRPPADVVGYLESLNGSTELEACALWCRQQLAANPGARLLVIANDVSGIRGRAERAMLRLADAPFEFSLGVPLGQIALIQSAVFALRWLEDDLDEHELDWLLSSGNICSDTSERYELLHTVRKLRTRQLERPRWSLDEFMRERGAALKLPAAFVQRMRATQLRLMRFQEKPRYLRDFAELIPQLLDDIGWPGAGTLGSQGAQAIHAWHQALETCGSCGFTGKRISWNEFLQLLGRVVGDALFAPESLDAPIQIMGATESAGLSADAVWFLGADEVSWPSSGSTHPFLPLSVQQAAGMPHATAQLDWDMAQAVTARLVQAAPQVLFSYARQRDGVEMRPSSLVAQLAGHPRALPVHLLAPSLAPPGTVESPDVSCVPFPPGQLKGGASVLSTQSQCPFKAFAVARLDARSWEAAQAGLTPAVRGQLLHAVMHSVWAGQPHGVRSLEELLQIQDIRTFVEEHVRRVLPGTINSELSARLPQRYLEIEQTRLTRLVTEWLQFEATRIAFYVLETEAKKNVTIRGLTLSLRLDRVDALVDESRLIIDYKSGDISPKVWDVPRPEDVQLPLYATYGLAADEKLGGLVFAKIRSGKTEFSGTVRVTGKTLKANLNAKNRLLRSPLSDKMVQEWKYLVERLANDFLSGRATADPREYPTTCEECKLQTLCRIQEFPPEITSDSGSDEEDDE